MKLAIEIALGMVAFSAAFLLGRPEEHVAPSGGTTARNDPTSVTVQASSRSQQPPGDRAWRHAPAPAPAPPPKNSAAPRGDEIVEMRALKVLRNAAIEAVAEDMHRRHTDLMHCLADADLAGANKLRLAASVVAAPEQAAISRWRFVEVAEGEPMPASFAACAAEALGGDQQLTPPEGTQFPSYAGDLEIIYTVPAPVAE